MMRESIAIGNDEGRVLPVVPAVAKQLVEVWNDSNAEHTGLITACKVCEVPRRAVGGGGPDSDDDSDDSDDSDVPAAVSVSRCTANALSIKGGVGWMLAADPSLEGRLGQIGSGAFLTSDGRLNKKLIYETLHSLPADAKIAQVFAEGAGSSGGVCGYVRSIQSDLSDAGSGAPNTRSRCLGTWDDAAEFAIAVRQDYITLACLPALRVRMSQEQLDDTDLIVVATVTTAKKQIALRMSLGDVIPLAPRAHVPKLVGDATAQHVQHFLSSTFAQLASDHDCKELQKAIPRVITEELSSHMIETALQGIGTSRGVVVTAFLGSKGEARPFACLTPRRTGEMRGFGLPVPDLPPAAANDRGADRRSDCPGRHVAPKPVEPRCLLEKLKFNLHLASLSGVAPQYTNEEASTLVAAIDSAIHAANGDIYIGYVAMCMCMYVYMNSYVCVCVFVCIHKHAHTHTHTPLV
jgi:hypothetical protein